MNWGFGIMSFCLLYGIESLFWVSLCLLEVLSVFVILSVIVDIG